MADPRALRIALLAYRGNPHCGGQGVYVRHLSAALGRLGHRVTVLSGQPYPDVEPGVRLVRLASLDLYRPEDPFRRPALREFRDRIDALEFAIMCTAGFPEPLAFSLRARRWLAARAPDFDVVHDNQCLGYGLLGLPLPVVATVHHPITVDRKLELIHAATWKRKLSLRRWYGFTRMQTRVARRLPRLVTVSETSRDDIVRDLGVEPTRLAVVPVGVDTDVFRPLPEVPRVPGRLVAIASADVPMKGLGVLVEALGKLRTERDAELVVVGRVRAGDPARATVRKFGLESVVRFVSGISEQEVVRLYAEAEVAVVASLYEGFSLPAVQAMACGVPLVATTGGALPEVAGRDGRTALLVPPGDPGELARAVGRLLDDPARRHRMGDAGRRRVLSRFTWEATARGTADVYLDVLQAALPSC